MESEVHGTPSTSLQADDGVLLPELERSLLQQRKLVMLLDLDNTLIHARKGVFPGLKNVYVRQLENALCPEWFSVRIRPGARWFLHTMSRYFQLHMATQAVSLYADSMRALLEEGHSFFKTPVFARQIGVDRKADMIKGFFDEKETLVVKVDDRQDVWDYAVNLVPIAPYIYLPLRDAIAFDDGAQPTAVSSESPVDLLSGDVSTQEAQEEEAAMQAEREQIKKLDEKFKQTSREFLTICIDGFLDASFLSEMQSKVAVADEGAGTSASSSGPSPSAVQDEVPPAEKMEEDCALHADESCEKTTCEAKPEDINNNSAPARALDHHSLPKEGNAPIGQAPSPHLECGGESGLETPRARSAPPPARERFELGESSVGPAGKAERDAEPRGSEAETTVAIDLQRPITEDEIDFLTQWYQAEDPEHDDDEQLLTMALVLMKIHTVYFRICDRLQQQGFITVPTVRAVMKKMRQKVLQGVVIVFGELNGRLQEKAFMASSLGARLLRDVGDPRITHFVVGDGGGYEWRQAKSFFPRVPSVGVEWLDRCFQKLERVDVEEFLFYRESKTHV